MIDISLRINLPKNIKTNKPLKPLNWSELRTIKESKEFYMLEYSKRLRIYDSFIDDCPIAITYFVYLPKHTNHSLHNNTALLHEIFVKSLVYAGVLDRTTVKYIKEYHIIYAGIGDNYVTVDIVDIRLRGHK